MFRKIKISSFLGQDICPFSRFWAFWLLGFVLDFSDFNNSPASASHVLRFQNTALTGMRRHTCHVLFA